ncbi:hypothetical protein ACFST9_05365 [Hymenobacter monticola]|uniref:Novel STAND NTPase 1 domain-containing protein n=1 Tax=Hymenobacter monticola TaxID=1705399 RepID=A0ABY4BA65_9BACT|nr:hypothetical protein [Hymenobacter monticola]UOE36048.1 hypothetical protein MTP16_10500 [Hymenobacter monticola]
MEAFDTSAAALLGLDEPICPYAGLRTFTEDEAIYFRGRESHVAKCLALLVEQRFVMITGASGDGKSSLVFAGMLPEVRAGFMRARYSNWAVATFRPERSPLRNLAQAVASALRLPSAGSVETELERGFSALVQLYQASDLHLPDAPAEGSTTAEQRQQQRQAANLLLVVDQFEEFFTNPENYDGDQPNTAAQTVVNLLLETTRLAQAQNLPIYIVCTMRSDFVGQCAEFRGLIEQVGASQYFVPRLLRQEFLEVIREPALLSGNRISERLVQRLLYDIGQGQDQLPVLQHALRRIWLAADQGREEMDLLHYAMVGGLADELPPENQARFAQWRATLTEPQRAFLLDNPGLRNVLDAHANQLFADANDLYNREFSPPLPPGTAQRVIEQTFRVLTRTDGKRVVRNRLTGAQITAILADEALPWPVVCRILRPFREEGTTFLSPFLGPAGDGHAVLPPDTVLDISHESLIRNWGHLAEWARNEATDVRIAQNLMQQSSRWQENAESKDFLLPIGLYTFFSQWHAGKKGLANWLAYYLNAGTEGATTPAQMAAENNVLTRFLAASKRRLRFTLVVARYGPWRLAAAVLVLALLGWLGRQAWHFRTVQSDYVAYSIVREGLENPDFQSSFVDIADRARFILNADRVSHHMYRPWLSKDRPEDYQFKPLLNALSNDTLALNIELSMYACVDNMSYDSVGAENPQIRPILKDLNARLERSLAKPSASGETPKTRSKTRWRNAVLTARTVMAFAYYLKQQAQHPKVYTDSAEERGFRYDQQRRLQYLRTHLQREIADTTGPAPNPVDLAFCLRVLLAQGKFRSDSLAFLGRLSPFGPQKQVFQHFFPPTVSNYRTGQTTNSGGYPMAAIVFAALDSTQSMRKCLAVMAQQKADFIDVSSGIALLPYLVKYQRLTPGNLHDILAACARPGGFSFNELYACLVYSLLSVQPTQDIFDANQSAGDRNADYQKQARATGYEPGYLSGDRVSFALPVATRDVAWNALLKSVPDVARRESIFVETEDHDLANAIPEGYYIKRNQNFLEAFLAKMHGVYLAEIRHDTSRARVAFRRFSASFEELGRHLPLHPKGKAALYERSSAHTPQVINSRQWNLGLPQQLPRTTGTTQASMGFQNPLTFLRLPIRPKTLNFETYYTCPFDAFFHYELTRAARQHDKVALQFLDSLAFVEAAFPDRFSATRTRSLYIEALARPAEYVPNLAWMRAIARVGTAADSDRRQRNELLLSIESALQNHSRLQDSVATHQLAARMKPALAKFSHTQFELPLQIAFSDLAAAVAREGRLDEAFDIAHALGEPLEMATKLRAGEQAMLINDRRSKAFDRLTALEQEYNAASSKQASRSDFSTPAIVITLSYWTMGDVGAVGWYFENLFLSVLGYNEILSATNTSDWLMAVCRGYGLTNIPGSAKEQIPDYTSARSRQIYYNTILVGIAHLNDHRPNNGWREYDEAELTRPAEYD